MFKKFLRWPFLLLFAALLFVVLIPTLSLLHSGKPGTAHALGNATVPAISAASSVSNGKPFHLHVQGFAPLEQIQMSWDGNGAQFLGFLHADATGGAYNCVKNVAAYFDCLVPPPTLSGSYKLTAIGSKSKSQTSTIVKVVPGIALSPNIAGPGSTLQIIGGGFVAGVALSVYFQDTANGTIAVKTDSNGFFVQTLTIPTTYDPLSSYSIHVANMHGVDLVKEPFSFAPTSIASSLTTVTHGVPVNISGKGFLANESVRIYWNYQQAGQVLIGTAAANTSGAFFLPVTTPVVPNAGPITLAGIGQSSNLQATTTVTQQVALVFTPAQGLSGSKIQISGGGFAPNEKITISSQKTLLTSVTSDANGAFSFTYAIPANTPSGIFQSQAVGATSRITLQAQFTVLPELSITPVAGSSGTTITVTGQNYGKNSQIEVYWYDPDPPVLPIPTPSSVASPTATSMPVDATATAAGVTVPLATVGTVVTPIAVTPTVTIQATVLSVATPVQKLLVSVKTDANGVFQATIMAPLDLVAGKIYSIRTRDTSTQVQTQTPFSVQ